MSGKRKIAPYRFYKGQIIWRSIEPGYRLPWTCGRLAADTLAGIKRLISEG